MTHSLAGDAVLRGGGVGRVVHWSPGRELPRRRIVVAAFLSNELAMRALDSAAIGIITEDGSFATHGANLLRVGRTSPNKRPELFWITRVPNACRRLREGTRLEVTGGGELIWSDSDCEAENQPARTSVSLVESGPREIVRWRDGAGVTARCYWPHRSYDVFTADVMTAGLARCVKAMGYDCRITRSQAGNIWFLGGGAPSLGDIRERALTLARARPLLDEQVAVYRDILNFLNRYDKAANSDALKSCKELVRYIRLYFRVFLLYHNTYEDVIRSAVTDLPATVVSEVIDTVVRTDLTEWQYRTQTVLVNEKDLFQSSPVIPLPDVTLDDDLTNVRARVASFLRRDSGEAIRSHANQPVWQAKMEYAALVCVVKEWKFFLNKALYSRFNLVARSLMEATTVRDLKDPAGWRTRRYRNVMRSLEEDMRA